jgi:hypothetical protein
MGLPFQVASTSRQLGLGAMGKSYPGLFDQVDGISLRKHGTPSLRSAKLKWT